MIFFSIKNSFSIKRTAAEPSGLLAQPSKGNMYKDLLNANLFLKTNANVTI